jgi:hypothetical protein
VKCGGMTRSKSAFPGLVRSLAIFLISGNKLNNEIFTSIIVVTDFVVVASHQLLIRSSQKFVNTNANISIG